MMERVAACCEPQGYDRVFNDRQAGRDAARYRRSGLTWAPRRTVEMYREGLIGGSTLLEIGGGVGDLQLELLTAGVRNSVSVELSGAYDAAAGRLLQDAGLAGRAVRVTADFAVRPEVVEPADLVVMHSVVCCYPRADRLVAAAAGRTRRHLVISYPRRTWWLRTWAPVQNVYPRLRGSDFRFYVHPPEAIIFAAASAGLRQDHAERNWIDHLVVLSRPA
jgi:hypothetical protein